MQFVLHADGRREIKNFVIAPVEKCDDFDFVGGDREGWEAVGNQINEFITDPSSVRNDDESQTFGIGRTVPFVYTDLEKIPRISSYTLENYKSDQMALRNNNYSTNGITISARMIDLWRGTLHMYWVMHNEGIISFKDKEGRSVYYGVNDVDDIDLDDLKTRDFSFANRVVDFFTVLYLSNGSSNSLIDIENVST